MKEHKEKQLTLKEENPVIPEHIITDYKDVNAVMYLFLNRDLHMSTGKAAAQVAHAAVQAYKISNPVLIDAWEKGLHYTKLVMLARDFEHLSAIQNYINRRGFQTELIIDEGLTEIDAHVQLL
jgi:peptidyl-tRNA hydrolase